MIVIELLTYDFDEIISILAKNGRSDLINAIRRVRDDDYKPTRYNSPSSSDCSSGEEEELDVVIDKDGFCALRDC